MRPAAFSDGFQVYDYAVYQELELFVYPPFSHLVIPKASIDNSTAMKE
jgi:hypothetical protein